MTDQADPGVLLESDEIQVGRELIPVLDREQLPRLKISDCAVTNDRIREIYRFGNSVCGIMKELVGIQLSEARGRSQIRRRRRPFKGDIGNSLEASCTRGALRARAYTVATVHA